MAEHASTADAEEVARSEAYGLLGALLAAPPNEELLSVLRAIPTPDQTAHGDNLAQAWGALRLAAEQATPAGLDDEYHDLFIGVGRGELVPYGSWYMTGFMMDQPLAILRQDLKTLGFERQHHVTETEDHIAALCETMGMIVSTHSEIEFHTAKKFFDDHLAPWAGLFFQNLRNAKTAEFYRAVGQFGEAFVAFEKQYLNMAV